jgi:hypothetical protein
MEIEMESSVARSGKSAHHASLIIMIFERNSVMV